MTKSLNLDHKKNIQDIHLKEMDQGDDVPDYHRVHSHTRSSPKSQEKVQIENLNLFLKLYGLDKKYEVYFLSEQRKPFCVYDQTRTVNINNPRCFKTIEKAHKYVQSLLDSIRD